MKTKILCLLLALLFVFSLTACGDTTKDTDKDTTKNGTEKSGEFVVSGEKYTYKDNDVLLLNVENQTDKHYNVTAVVHYFDTEGNEIKAQKQSFAGWASGYQNYFFFQPNIIFATFTYDLELEEVSGEECYAKCITTAFAGLEEMMGNPPELINKGDYTDYPIIYSHCKVINKSESVLNVVGRYIVFDKNNNIYSLEGFGGKYFPYVEDIQVHVVYWEKTTEKFVWPDELKGDVSAIFVVTSVKPS